LKFLVLYTRLSGYMIACLQVFKSAGGHEILTVARAPHADAPFDKALVVGIGNVYSRDDFNAQSLIDLATGFRPDAVLVSGWADADYVKVCRKLKKSGVPIIAGCDTQWTGSLRQRIAASVAPWYVKKFIDVMWVTGDRQHKLAGHLGYSGEQCWDGFYACDREKFVTKEVSGGADIQPPNFLFVGRYIPQKGLDTLATAYVKYCAQVSDPWSLVCAGAGPLESTLQKAGAQLKGFVQPDLLPGLMHQCACFVLPSVFEPWGVVVQEAAASGLPLILSAACGAGDHLLKHGQNGFVFPAGDADQLCKAMLRVHNLSAHQRQQFGRISMQLSEQYTPRLWADKLQSGIARLVSAGTVELR